MYFIDNIYTDMVRLAELHESVIYYLTLIFIAVGWVLLSILINCVKAYKSGGYGNHDTLKIWSIIIFILCCFFFLSVNYQLHLNSESPEFIEGINSNEESNYLEVNSEVPVYNPVPEDSSNFNPFSFIYDSSNFNPFSFIYDSIVPDPAILAEHVGRVPLIEQTGSNSFFGLNTVDSVDVPTRIRSLNEMTTTVGGMEILDLSPNHGYPVRSIPNSAPNIVGPPIGWEVGMGSRERIHLSSFPTVVSSMPNTYTTEGSGIIQYNTNVLPLEYSEGIMNTNVLPLEYSEGIMNTNVLPLEYSEGIMNTNALVPQGSEGIMNTNALVSQGSGGIINIQNIPDQTGLIVGAPYIQNVFGIDVPYTELSNNNLMSNYIPPVSNQDLNPLGWDVSIQFPTDPTVYTVAAELPVFTVAPQTPVLIALAPALTFEDQTPIFTVAPQTPLLGVRSIENPIIINDGLNNILAVRDPGSGVFGQTDIFKKSIIDFIIQKTNQRSLSGGLDNTITKLTSDYFNAVNLSPNEYEALCNLLGEKRLNENCKALCLQNTFVRFVDSDKLLYTRQPNYDSLTGIVEYVGRYNQFKDVLNSEESQGTYLYDYNPKPNKRKRVVYKLIGYMHHPGFREGLFKVQGDGGLLRDYVPNRSGHWGLELYISADWPHNTDYVPTGIIAGKSSNFSEKWGRYKNIYIMTHEPVSENVRRISGVKLEDSQEWNMKVKPVKFYKSNSN
jgi:hypothetical protein